ncbi:MAG TPA: SDR family oxidoreductase [Anaerolineales bacterium]|nr:SDR family oxidoreductase [Anaerolineales bacterium]
MKLTIFGASSSSGRLVVEKALAAGHEVTAFVRDPAKLGITNESLKVVAGDALNAAQVEEAVKGSDAVLSTLGPKGKPAVMAAQSARNIIDAMEKHGVKRLVMVSVAGISVPQDKRGFNLVSTLIKLLLKDVFVDRENQLKALEESSLDWIAVRVPRLTDGSATGSVNAFFGNASPAMKVTRADLADFMLEQLTSDQWRRQAPILSN